MIGADLAGTAVAGTALASAGLAWALLEVALWLRERLALRRALASVVPGGRLQGREDVVALWRWLSAHVDWRPARDVPRRPLLRASAGATLRSGVGLCGENARLAVRLLRLGGVPANRLYLFGPGWGHVVVECRVDGEWRLFDAHADEATLPTERQVARLATWDIVTFPNDVDENPWLDAATLKPLRGKGRWARRRPPAPLVLWMESPHLIRATAALALVAAGVLLGLWV